MALDDHGHPRFEWLVNRGAETNAGLLRFRSGQASRSGLQRRTAQEAEEKLKRLLKNQSRLLYVDHLEREGLAMFAGALALGLEGIVAKDAASPYVEGPQYERQEKIEFSRLS